MKRIIGIALLVGGIIALVYGFKAKDSIESKVTETFTGAPSDNAKWLLIGGAVASAAGVGLILIKKP
ncbi:MAG: DUF3185 family protein [Verrucomicrobia bacterium]|jgi:uncharacterized membrane protein HdeD (DUF308 family)|nr:DUF3185 family protein [Verrucomicrobiota bacterium]